MSYDRYPSDLQPIDVMSHIEELFALDSKVAAISPDILPLESPEELIDFLTVQHQSETYVWRDEGNHLIASISVVNDPESSNFEVLNIGVDPSLQRSGYGTKLLQFAEELAIKAAKEKIVLVTAVSNNQAINFYQKNGFDVGATIENIYADGKPRYLLEKILAKGVL